MIGRVNTTTVLLCLFFLMSIICRNGSPGLYFIGDAVCWVIVCLILVLNLQGLHKIIAECIMLLAINNLMDELFFDPTKTSINECVFFALVAIWTIKRIYKHVRLRSEKRGA